MPEVKTPYSAKKELEQSVMASESSNREQQLADPKLLDKIDQLFALNIGDHVALPQLVVVGDQSSGKSSVLEGLTGIPFPRDSGLCTRFATQIIFRRDVVASIAVSLIPATKAGHSNHNLAEKFGSWKKNDLKRLDKENFLQILREVYEIMGLNEKNSDGSSKKTFTDDVLRIEIRGPTQEHLSVIDVPGIFKRTTAGVTTKADIDLVKSMVLSYMKNPRSVILAVVPANVDIATQEILESAEECDPEGRRTLGVFTKPDLVDGGAEQAVLSVVEGKSHQLNLGWCIVRNPGQQELSMSMSERSSAEKAFFNTKDPWTKLAKDRIGTEALRLRLVEVLGEMVYREFSAVKREIGNLLREKKKDLEILGPSRESKEQQYQFLLDLAVKFQTISSYALRARYGSDNIFEENPHLKIATEIVKRNDAFSDDMARLGHTLDFDDAEHNAKIEATPPEVEYEDGNKNKPPVWSRIFDDAERSAKNEAAPPEEENEDDDEGNTSSTKQNLRRNSRQQYREYDELEDIVVDGEGVSEPSSSAILPWLKDFYTNARGFELGTFDASILPIVWKKQTNKWGALALGYTSDVVTLMHGFTLDLLSQICDDRRLERAILGELLESLLERYRKGMTMTQFLLDVEHKGTPLTMNDLFNNNLQRSRQQRIKSTLRRKTRKLKDGTELADIDAAVVNTVEGNLDNAVSDLHDLLHAYYQVARKRFVDNVCMQSVDHYLVMGPDSPITVFSPAFVSRLSAEQLDRIAGDEASTRRKRAQLVSEIKALEKGRKILI